MYGNIGFTRRDKTPEHWKEGYRLTQASKDSISNLHSERKRLTLEHTDLYSNDNLSDEVVAAKSAEIQKELNFLLEEEDRIRKENKK